MSNVVGIGSAKPAVADQEDLLVEDLRGALWSNGRANQWKLIADKARLSYSTVYNMAMERTRRPHHHTITQIAMAIGLRLALVPMGTPKLKEEVDLSKNRGRRSA